jgi:hypothetical protein
MSAIAPLLGDKRTSSRANLTTSISAVLCIRTWRLPMGVGPRRNVNLQTRFSNCIRQLGLQL